MTHLKHLLLLAAIALGTFSATLSAQDFTKVDTLKFVNGLNFRLINYAFDRTLHSRHHPRQRAPDTLGQSTMHLRKSHQIPNKLPRHRREI